MKISRLTIFLLAIAMMGISCEKRSQPVETDDDAKLRPEVAVAKQGASPTPLAGEASATPAPSP